MAEQNPDLLKQAEELTIKVDGRWSDERIQSAIDAKLSDAPHERTGTAYDPHAANYELQGRDPAPASDPLDHDGDGKKGGAAPHLVAVSVRRDFWDESGERHRKGTVVEVSVEAALDGVEVGALSRVR